MIFVLGARISSTWNQLTSKAVFGRHKEVLASDDEGDKHKGGGADYHTDSGGCVICLENHW